jgi:hypothetical protein
MAAQEDTLEIVFRYLMLYYSSPDGLRVLVPAHGHRATLRDRVSGVSIPLTQSTITLTADGAPFPGTRTRTRVKPNERIVVVENALKVKDPVAPDNQFLQVPVHSALHSLVSLGGGALTAFLPEAFPERDEPVEIVFGPGNKLLTRITDTTVWSIDLPKGRQYELIVKSPRTALRIDVTGGARFELRNEEEVLGPIPDRVKYHSEEFRTLLKFFGATTVVECDQYACGFMLCGEGPIVPR